MKKIETNTGYYANKDRSIIGKSIYLPDFIDESDFELISEEDGEEIIKRHVEEGAPSDVQNI